MDRGCNIVNSQYEFNAPMREASKGHAAARRRKRGINWRPNDHMRITVIDAGSVMSLLKPIRYSFGRFFPFLSKPVDVTTLNNVMRCTMFNP
jgi:hypothetical protein